MLSSGALAFKSIKSYIDDSDDEKDSVSESSRLDIQQKNGNDNEIFLPSLSIKESQKKSSSELYLEYLAMQEICSKAEKRQKATSEGMKQLIDWLNIIFAVFCIAINLYMAVSTIIVFVSEEDWSNGEHGHQHV